MGVLIFKVKLFANMLGAKKALKYLNFSKTRSKNGNVKFIVKRNPKTKTWVVILKRRSGTLIIDTKLKRSSALMVKKILNALVRK